MLPSAITAVLLFLAGASTIAWLVALMRQKGIHPIRGLVAFFKNQSKAGRVLLGTFFIAIWIIAGTKPSGNVGNEGYGDGGANNVQMVVGLVGDPAPVTDQWSDFTPITSTNTTHTLTGDDFRRGFVLARVGTGEEFDFSAPPGATACSDWRAFGAAEDWMYLAFSDWSFSLGTNEVDRLRVFSFGKAEPLPPATNLWFAPLMASIGVVPQAN